MKTLRVQSGPFKERPYYTDQEIESICSDELNRVGLFPTSPQPVRIDRFVEKRFGVVPSYEDLPEGILGFTKFGHNGVQAIVVSRQLSEDASNVTERRVSTTLAHESGHGLLHMHLFALEQRGLAPRLFGHGLDRDGQKILCRPDGVQGTRGESRTINYDGRWWEYQANRAIGALLLPRTLALQALEFLLEGHGALGLKTLSAERRETAALALVDTFDVNPIVARIRLEDLFPPIGDQLAL